MANGHGSLPRMSRLIRLRVFLDIVHHYHFLMYTYPRRKKSEYSRCTDISLSKLQTYLYGIPVEHQVSSMPEVNRAHWECLRPAPDVILITGGESVSIETLVNIHYLRKNNTDFEGGFLE
jgi:hypothetical protein